MKKLTKALLDEAKDLLSDSENLSKAEQVKEVGRQWADSVLALAAAVERGSQPWGNPLSRLTTEAAKGGKQLEHEVCKCVCCIRVFVILPIPDQAYKSPDRAASGFCIGHSTSSGSQYDTTRCRNSADS